MESRSQIMLTDGRVVVLRPALPVDAPALSEMLGKCDPDDVRMSRLDSLSRDYQALTTSLCRADPDEQLTLLASLGDGYVVGFARVTRDPAGPSGEFDLLVLSKLKRLGLGRAMLERLLAAAHRHGVTALHAEVLADNGAMIDLARHLGAIVHGPDEGGTLRLSFS